MAATMFFRKFNRLERASGRTAGRLPEGRRVYAIGDIHGRRDLLDQLLTDIQADDEARSGAETHLIFLGDLVDRGPDSAGVVQRALELGRSTPQARFIMGNHDGIFLRALRGDRRALRYFAKIGGRATIRSYGISDEEYCALDDKALMATLIERVPQEHVEFLKSFEDYIIEGDYLFVHAGIRPGVAIEEQTSEDLQWIREEFLVDRRNHGQIVIHGHTISPEVERLPNRIGIDTGAYKSGRLTALGLEDEDVWVLTATGPESADT
jgi:serine/threonine protein phosphatase 1